MKSISRLLVLLALAGVTACSGTSPVAIGNVADAVRADATGSLQTGYYVYVAAESEDQVYLIRFDGRQSAEVVDAYDVSIWPTEIDGPHGMTVSPDGNYWYVTIAHGAPYGRVIKYRTETGEKVGEELLGLFPASMQISQSTGLLYVVNFNLHGGMEPSSVSVVEPRTMSEVYRITTGVMPHGSRLSPDGKYHYSVAMMDGDLYEIDAVRFEVSRVLNTATGETKTPTAEMHEGHQMAMAGDGPAPKPTWVHPHPTKPFVYVANNGSDEIVEVNLETWKIARRFPAAGAPYNLEVSPDGRLLVSSLKKAGKTGVYDLETGDQVALIDNARRVTHGVAISPDSKFAFISVEGIGGEPGTVDVIDLTSLSLAASVDVGKQAGGIAFWKIDR